MFFDAFPRFYETTQTHASAGRLNLRYEAIFTQNADVFKDARVLDIASHDGRWSLAALRSGAAEVVGIEARDDLVKAARENLAAYAPGTRYDFRIRRRLRGARRGEIRGRRRPLPRIPLPHAPLQRAHAAHSRSGPPLPDRRHRSAREPGAADGQAAGRAGRSRAERGRRPVLARGAGPWSALPPCRPCA